MNLVHFQSEHFCIVPESKRVGRRIEFSRFVIACANLTFFQSHKAMLSTNIFAVSVSILLKLIQFSLVPSQGSAHLLNDLEFKICGFST